MKVNNPIDIFIDLEGLGMSEVARRNVGKITYLAEELPIALRREGHDIASVTGFACYSRPNSFKCSSRRGVGRVYRIVPLWTQALVSDTFKSHGWKMVWSSSIADHALIHDVCDRLEKGVLSDTVMIIANDHDFIGLVNQLKEANRQVLVAGPGMNKRLQAAAHRAFHLWDFLEMNAPRGGKNHTGQNETLFNPIPLL